MWDKKLKLETGGRCKMYFNNSQSAVNGFLKSSKFGYFNHTKLTEKITKILMGEASINEFKFRGSEGGDP